MSRSEKGYGAAAFHELRYRKDQIQKLDEMMRVISEQEKSLYLKSIH